jgi:hypothetical protein
MTLRGQLGLQYLNIGEIKGKLDHRAHRVVRPGSGLRCSDSIAPASVTTTSSGYHGRSGRALNPVIDCTIVGLFSKNKMASTN